jgi:hypothetical protein
VRAVWLGTGLTKRIWANGKHATFRDLERRNSAAKCLDLPGQTMSSVASKQRSRPLGGIFFYLRVNVVVGLVVCGPERDRTADLLTASQALSQLSYRPKRRECH